MELIDLASEPFKLNYYLSHICDQNAYTYSNLKLSPFIICKTLYNSL